MIINDFSTKWRVVAVSSFLVLGAGCGGESIDEIIEELTLTPEPEPTAEPVISEGLDFNSFLAEAIDGEILEVDCTLTDGSASRCYQFTTLGNPTDHDIGPFCPDTIYEGAEAGGKWIEGDTLVDITGDYIVSLPEVYNDPAWILYDVDTGDVNQVTGPVDCAAAAQANPPVEYWYRCIDCVTDDVGGTVATVQTVPIVPVARETIAELGVNEHHGMALNGVLFSFPAGIDVVLATYNIAALDDCAGHVNNAESYHYHGAAGCTHEIEQSDQHGPLIGYAMDAYGIYAMADLDGTEPEDLDECRGHTDDERGYHYHTASAGENTFIGCFHGETAVDAAGGGPGDDDGPGNGGPPPGDDGGAPPVDPVVAG